MPTYTYRCLQCENQFTIEARMSDAPPQSCPACRQSGQGLQKLMSPVLGWVKGSSPAPAPQAPVSRAAPAEDPVHLCSKYCDHHK